MMGDMLNEMPCPKMKNFLGDALAEELAIFGVRAGGLASVASVQCRKDNRTEVLASRGKNLS